MMGKNAEMNDEPAMDFNFKALSDRQNLDDTFLFIGSIVSLGIQQMLCFIYGGFFILLVSLMGVIAGIAMYYHFPRRHGSRISPERAFLLKKYRQEALPMFS